MARKYGKLLIQSLVGTSLLGFVVFAVLIGAGNLSGADVEREATLADIRSLWRDQGDFAQGRLLAEDFLATDAAGDIITQQVEFELGMIQYRSGDYDQARYTFTSLVQAYDTRGWDETVPAFNVDDALYRIGCLEAIQGRIPESLAALDEVIDRWPESQLALRSLQQHNRTVMQLPDLGTRLGDLEDVANEVIAQDVAGTVAPGVILDLMNLYFLPIWTGDEKRALITKAVDWAEYLVATYPDSPESWPARSEIASMIYRDDPERALRLADANIEHNRTISPGHLAAATWRKGGLLLNMERPAEALRLMQDAATYDGFTHHDRGQLQYSIALAENSLGATDDAIARLHTIVNDADIPDDVKAGALVHIAFFEFTLGNRQVAVATAELAVEQFSHVQPGQFAAQLVRDFSN
jgi:tetratricopeptide (TPR) repeat protein